MRESPVPQLLCGVALHGSGASVVAYDTAARLLVSGALGDPVKGSL